MVGPFPVAPLLEPVSPERPTGENLEYETAFTELERLVEGRPERRMGNEVIAAEEPDHRAAAQLASQLLGRSKDLRIASKLTISWARVGGFGGLAAGLDLIRNLLQAFWTGLYPESDPSDRDDPTRANVLLSLTDALFLNALRATPLVEARGLGRFAYRDIAAAAGEQPPSGTGTAPSLDAIQAAFAAAEVGPLQQTAAELAVAQQHVEAILSIFEAQQAPAPDLTPLSTLLARVRKPVDAALSRRQDITPSASAVGNVGGDAEPAAAVGGDSRAAVASVGQLKSRNDVMRLLDTIIEYYAVNEPSSPVPLLLKRAKRLVTASFLDIVKNIAPDSVGQFALLQGPEDDAQSESNT